MDSNIARQFIDTIIERTKDTKLAWSVTNKDDISPKSFVCVRNGVVMTLHKEDSYYALMVRFPGEQESINMDEYKDDAINAAIVRLYNLVYEKIPKIEDYMKDFMQSFE